ncbi:MAG: hypothetical protein E7001_03090 [Coriobacteriaceae bacterium]|nr:hypothetical protein [Coriobacteriaceae bacterium]
MINCVTGRAGEDHITGDDWGHLNAGIVGSGAYVLKTGNQLKATVASANSITISDGDAVLNGRHIRVSSPESVTIQSGTVGQRRNDIIVLRYARTGSGAAMREGASLVAVKGTSTTGAPRDPATGTGNVLNGSATADMPLYRIPIDGVTVGTPVPLFDRVVTAAEVRDYMSRGGAWSDLWREGDAHVSIRRCGPMTEAVWAFPQETPSVWSPSARVPEGLRPSRQVYGSATATDANGNPRALISQYWFGGDGRMSFAVVGGTAGTWHRGHAAWPYAPSATM